MNPSYTKYLDHITKKQFRESRKNILELCPNSKNCLHMGWCVDKQGAGVCCGIIHSVSHLDCIAMCIFDRDLETKDIIIHPHYMTPDEAAQQIRCLSNALCATYEYNSIYQKYFQHLRKIRKNGDKTP